MRRLKIMRKKNSSGKKIIIGAAVIVGLFFIISYLPLEKADLRIENATSTLENSEKIDSKPFVPPSIQAKAAYVYDLNDNRVIFAMNEDTPLPLASITKLMTALVSSQILSDDKTVTIEPSSLLIEGDNGLVANEKWRFKDLRDFTLMVSSNDGANALALAAGRLLLASTSPQTATDMEANEAFVSRMNSEANSLGLQSFYFRNESGLDVNMATPGAEGSARDVGTLLSYLIKNYPSLIEITKYRKFRFVSESGIGHLAVNTDEDIGTISHIVASKTGFTALAGGNLAVAYDPGLSNPIIIVVLGSTESGRFSDTMALASSTASYLRGH